MVVRVHGLASSYIRGCRCDLCKDAAREKRAIHRKMRQAERVMVNGRLFAPNASVHGTLGTYGNWGCRCEACTKAASAEGRNRHAKQTRKLAKALPPKTLKHGSTGAYRYWRCRCRVCKAGHKRRNDEWRMRVLDRRQEIDGRMVAVDDGIQHGLRTTYTNKGCRCEPCSKAACKDKRELPLRKARRRLAEAGGFDG